MKPQHSVTVLRADGTAFVVTHWETVEAALDQFKASLELAGHLDHETQRHLRDWERMPGSARSFTVYNPDFQGAVRLTSTRSEGW